MRLVEAGMPVELELGCGTSKTPGRIGIDRIDLPGVDIVADLENGLPMIPSRSVDRLYARSLLEHIEAFEQLMGEIVRVLKDRGTAHIFVPHFSNPYFYSDYTHRRFFGLYTFYYFVDEANQLKRKVPDFYSEIRIEVVRIRLKFTSPFKLARRWRKLYTAFFNASPRLQEFYEGSLTGLIPCYGLEVIFTPDRSSASRS